VLIDGETGFIVPRGGALALKARVELISDRDRRERMGRQARLRCRRDFDIDARVRRYEALFSELVSAAAPTA